MLKGHRLSTALQFPLQHFNQVEVWILTGPFHELHYFFFHSFVNFLLCLSSFSCCLWHNVDQASAVSYYRRYHILAHRGDYVQLCYKLPRTQGCKSWLLCVCAWQMVQGVRVNMLGLVFTKYRTVQRGQTSLRCNLVNPSHAFHLVFKEYNFCPDNISKQTIFVQSF